jgi:hypothetical protein
LGRPATTSSKQHGPSFRSFSTIASSRGSMIWDLRLK